MDHLNSTNYTTSTPHHNRGDLDLQLSEDIRARLDPLSTFKPAAVYKVGRQEVTQQMVSTDSGEVEIGLQPSDYAWPIENETIDPASLDMVIMRIEGKWVAEPFLSIEWITGGSHWIQTTCSSDLATHQQTNPNLSLPMRRYFCDAADAINAHIAAGGLIEPMNMAKHRRRDLNEIQFTRNEWNGCQIEQVRFIHLTPVWIHDVKTIDRTTDFPMVSFVAFPRLPCTKKDITTHMKACPIIDKVGLTHAERIAWLGLPISGNARTPACKDGLIDSNLDPDDFVHWGVHQTSKYGILLDAGLRVYTRDDGASIGRISQRMNTTLIPLPDHTEDEWLLNANVNAKFDGKPDGVLLTHFDFDNDDPREIVRGAIYNDGEVIGCTEIDWFQSVIMQNRILADWEHSLGSIVDDSGIPPASNTSQDAVDVSGRHVSWVDTWKDTRGIKTVDLTSSEKPRFHHLFIRCPACNGNVEIIASENHIPPSTQCPHCLTDDAIVWGEIQDRSY